jgi:hypothetical protein
MSEDEVIAPTESSGATYYFVDSNVFVAQPWVSEATERLNHLLTLPYGWDGFGAEPVRLRTAQSTLELLKKVLWRDAPLPQFAATVDGGIQLEWYRPSLLVSITVERGQRPNLYFRDNESEVSWEGVLGQEPVNLDKLLAHIGELT